MNFTMDFRTRRTFPFVSRSAEQTRTTRETRGAQLASRGSSALHSSPDHFSPVSRSSGRSQGSSSSSGSDSSERGSGSDASLRASSASAGEKTRVLRQKESRSRGEEISAPLCGLDLYGTRTEFRRQRGGMSLRQRSHCLQLQQTHK